MKSVLLVTILSLLVTPVRAVVIEIPLPGLLGAYPVNPAYDPRTVTFQLPAVPYAIHGASFRIAGTQTIGLADCREFGALDEWPMEFIAQMDDTPGHPWFVYEPLNTNPGEFAWTAEFEPGSEDTSWGFLMDDGNGDITLYGAPSSLLSLCDPIVRPTGTVTEAVLIIDGTFPLPVEASTWGRIKALYR